MDPTETIISKNLMEELVDLKLDSCIKEAGACQCPQCRADIRALALNRLPPRYIVSTAGGVFARVLNATSQVQADITTAIYSAISLVQEHPRHSEPTEVSPE